MIMIRLTSKVLWHNQSWQSAVKISPFENFREILGSMKCIFNAISQICLGNDALISSYPKLSFPTLQQTTSAVVWGLLPISGKQVKCFVWSLRTRPPALLLKVYLSALSNKRKMLSYVSYCLHSLKCIVVFFMEFLMQITAGSWKIYKY